MPFALVTSHGLWLAHTSPHRTRGVAQPPHSEPLSLSPPHSSVSQFGLETIGWIPFSHDTEGTSVRPWQRTRLFGKNSVNF